MNAAYQPVVEVLGDTLALLTRRERGVWPVHDTSTGILATAQGRFKAPRDFSDSLCQVGLGVRSLIGDGNREAASFPRRGPTERCT